MTVEQRGLLIGAVIAIGFFVYLQATKREPSQPQSQAKAAIIANSANDLLLKQSPPEQARILGEAIGHGCTGKVAFFMGIDKRETGYWSLRCDDSRTFMVKVFPERGGPMVGVECELLHALKTGITCFKPLRN